MNVIRTGRVATARAIWSLNSGERLRDKIAIGLMLARSGLFPLAALRRFGIAFPDPGRFIPAYTCRSDGLFIRCPGGGGPYFLFADPRHDPGVRAAIDDLEGGTFIDVGAHVGFFSLRAASRLADRGNVLAIEPHPVRRQFLQENVERNGLSNVLCLPYAIGEDSRLVKLYDLDSSLGRHQLDVSLTPSRGRSFEVPMRSLDSLRNELGAGRVTLIKIDVEGYESQVIAGMQQLLERWHPKVIFEALTRNSLEQSSAILARHHYRVRQVDRSNYLAEMDTHGRNSKSIAATC